MRNYAPIQLSPAEASALSQLLGSPETSTQVQLRARILLAATHGLNSHQISLQVGCSRRTAAFWRKRFQTDGLKCLTTAKPRSGRKPTVRNNCREQVLQMLRDDLALTGKRRSIRAIAQACKVSKDTVHRIAQQLHPTATTNPALSPNNCPLDQTTADSGNQSPPRDNQ
jgi:transposase